MEKSAKQSINYPHIPFLSVPLQAWANSVDPDQTAWSSLFAILTHYYMVKTLFMLLQLHRKLIELINELPHDKTNKMTGAQQRLRSAWASVHSMGS